MSAAKRSFAATSRGQLHYRRLGRGPVLILLQTIPFSIAIFDQLMEVLHDEFDCIAIDLMGYGSSDRREERWLVEDYADNLLEALDDLGVSRFGIISGHFSSMVALAVSETRPSAVTGLIIDGIASPPPEEAAANLARLKAAIPTDTDPRDRWDRLLRGAWDLLHKLDPELKCSATNREVITEAAFAHARNLLGPDPFDAALRFDARLALCECQVDVLLLTSSTDTQRQFHADNLARLPHGDDHRFPGINPLYQLDRPDRAKEYGDLALNFFRGRP